MDTRINIEETEVGFQRTKIAEKLLSETKTKAVSIKFGSASYAFLESQAKELGLTTTEYIRDITVKDAVGISVADRFEDRLTELNETLKFMRTRLNESTENQADTILNSYKVLMKEMNFRDAKLANLIAERDKEYAEITRNLTEIAAALSNRLDVLNG